ncbi:MAG: PAS domain S-box protein [Cyanobacteria bacterium SZAS-4]|nr:PAS domain S-box protein [Cyanobacteria bacterium SZAS-4]
MRPNLKLVHTGLILILVPFMFELIFVATLSYFLHKADEQAQIESRAKQLLLHTTNLCSLFENSGVALFGYDKTKADAFLQSYKATKSKTGTELFAVRSFLSGTSSQNESYARVQKDCDRAQDILNKAYVIITTNTEDAAKFRVESSYKLLKNTLLNLQNDVSILTQNEQTLKEQSQFVEQQLKQNIWLIIAAGVVGNLCLTIAMAVFFGKRLGQRLQILQDNSLRLAASKPLNKPLDGEDEIASVDRTFHQMTDALNEIKRKERAIVDNAVDVICSIDDDGKFVEVSASSLSAWGFEAAELIGRRVITMVHQDYYEKTLAAMTDAKSSADNFAFETVLVNSASKPVESRWTGTWSEADKTLFVVAHDTSEQKKIERLKREFVQMISHDLRSPLTAVQFFLELITEGFFDTAGMDNLKAKAATSEQDIGRLIQLVNNLLDIEKMESGKMEILAQMVPVQLIMERSANSIRNIAERRNIAVEVEESTAELYGDEQQLVQVLVNLISNAVKFSPSGEKVVVSARNDGEFVLIEIADKGRGIPPAVKAKIFDRFEQVELDDARLKGGTGLGLAICKTIVESHRGEIGVSSEEGVGSTFWIRIPAEPWQ